ASWAPGTSAGGDHLHGFANLVQRGGGYLVGAGVAAGQYLLHHLRAGLQLAAPRPDRRQMLIDRLGDELLQPASTAVTDLGGDIDGVPGRRPNEQPEAGPTQRTG